jgi:hypothetical protein
MPKMSHLGSHFSDSVMVGSNIIIQLLRSFLFITFVTILFLTLSIPLIIPVFPIRLGEEARKGE